MRFAPLVPRPKPPAPKKNKPQTPPLYSSYEPPKTSESDFFGATSASDLSSLGVLPKLEVGAVNDPLEREADAIADRVMRMPAPSRERFNSPAPEAAESNLEIEAEDSEEELTEAPTIGAFAGGAALPGSPKFLARQKCAACEAEEKDEKSRRALDDEILVRKCRTCEDEGELRRACASCDAKENDEIRRESTSTPSVAWAPLVGWRMRTANLAAQPAWAPLQPRLDFLAPPRAHTPWLEHLRRTFAPNPAVTFAGPVSRHHTVDCWNGKPPSIYDSFLARSYETCRESAAGWRGGETSGLFAEQLRGRVRSGGRPLSVYTRNFLEPRLGVDLGHVRVHEDAAGDSLAQRINARAFSVGKDIFFRSGEARPTTHAGMRLLAHEVAHTLQASASNALQPSNTTDPGHHWGDYVSPHDGARPPLDTAPHIQRSSADDLVSSTDNTADAVLDDALAGAFYISNAFEERVRKLSKRERKLLHELLTSQSFDDQAYFDQLIEELEKIMAGHIGTSSGQIDSRPCEPGDVKPVSMSNEWDGDIILIDLELLGGEGESHGKLGRHTPSATLRLFQRALIQWGCESASPGRNPLPKFGANGKYGDEFRGGVRQFQRGVGLSADGTAGPRTVRAMATELYGINLREQVERRIERDLADDKLATQKAADTEFATREDRIQRFIDVLYRESGRFRDKQGGDQYKVNAAAMVANTIDGFGAEIISEGLERVQLGNPAFYERVLFGGRLITALQDRGVYGVKFKASNDVDFLEGFIIEANELEHNSPLSVPKFSGKDKVEILWGFVKGAPEGAVQALKDNVEGIVALADPEFWTAMFDMVPKLLVEPNFRFDIGRVSAEALYSQLEELNASEPEEYGHKLGVLFGMLVFELAANFFTGGIATALKGVKGAKLLSKFPRMERLAKRIASSSLVRAGVALGKKLRKTATTIIERVDDVASLIRKLLPELTNDAKVLRQVDEFADADAIEALATKRELMRKLDELKLEQEKLELALAQADPDFDQVERLAKNAERKADEIEDLVARKKLDKRDDAPDIEDHVDVPDSAEPDGHGTSKRNDKHKEEGKGKSKHEREAADKHRDTDSDPDGHHDPDSDPKKPKHKNKDDADEHRSRDDDDVDEHRDRDDNIDNDGKAKDKDNLLLAAKRASQAAWSRAKSRAASRVVSAGQIEGILRKASHVQGRVRIRVTLVIRSGSWSVRAKATARRSSATATAGRGWIAKGDGGKHFYAVPNLSSFNRKLIKDTLRELRKDDKSTRKSELRAAYRAKVERGRELETKQQSTLDRKLHGLKFRVDMEPFSGVEKDKKIHTRVSVKPNTEEQTAEIPIEDFPFGERFKVDRPINGLPVKKAGKDRVSLSPIKPPPMLGKDKLPGFVVNIVGQPKDARQGMASKYFDAAWMDSDVRELARARTAVIIGINGLRSIDPKEEKEKELQIKNAIPVILHPKDSLVAAFGFQWEPHWKEKKDKDDRRGVSVGFDKVRNAWKKLPTGEQSRAREEVERPIFRQENLPYGTIRNQVVESRHTKTAARYLHKVGDPIHALTQDPDGKADKQLAHYDNFLKAYDETTEDIRRHPLMTIGGYTFSGFEWGKHDKSRLKQLTILANEIDRAIRIGISKSYPGMQYPTEPSMLVKLLDEQHKDGILDREGGEKDLFGPGRGEGRYARYMVEEANKGENPHKNPIAYAPEAATVTSPEPNKPERGLAVTEDKVRSARKAGEHPYDAVASQTQSMASPRALNREFQYARRVLPSEAHPDFQNEIFSHVSTVGRALADDPSLTEDSEKIKSINQELQDAIETAKEKEDVRDNEKLKKSFDLAHIVVREIIKAMTSTELKSKWQELKNLLDEIVSEGSK